MGTNVNVSCSSRAVPFVLAPGFDRGRGRFGLFSVYPNLWINSSNRPHLFHCQINDTSAAISDLNLEAQQPADTGFVGALQPVTMALEQNTQRCQVMKYKYFLTLRM